MYFINPPHENLPQITNNNKKKEKKSPKRTIITNTLYSCGVYSHPVSNINGFSRYAWMDMEIIMVSEVLS